MAGPSSHLPLAGYYADSYLWCPDDSDAIKSILPFFDVIVTTLPEGDLSHYSWLNSEHLAVPLLERGLLRSLDLRELISKSELYSEVLMPMAKLSRWDQGLQPQYNGWSYSGDIEITKGLIKRFGWEGSITTFGWHDPTVRHYFFSHLAKVVFDAKSHLELDINLLTFGSRHIYMREWKDPFKAYGVAHHNYAPEFEAIWSDLQTVGVDLAAVPLDEVLDFRDRHGPQYRAYMRGLREFAVQLAKQRTAAGSEQLLAERREQLEDESADLRKLSQSAFAKSSAIIAIAAAGTAWGIGTGDAVAATLSTLSSLLSLPQVSRPTVTPFAYLFAFDREFYGRRW